MDSFVGGILSGREYVFFVVDFVVLCIGVDVVVFEVNRNFMDYFLVFFLGVNVNRSFY